MRAISSKTHGVIDYIYGLILIFSPWLFGFGRGGPETWVLVVIGTAMIALALITNNETGIFKVVSMESHLWIDGLAGAVLVFSPWIFGFREIIFWPHIIFGVIELGTALMTDPIPHTRTTH